MIIHDPIYGRFLVPPSFEPILLAPEVRRLSDVRLLNTISPSLAALTDIRRFAHTLGALHLAFANSAPGYSLEEQRALQASVILHDIGTPAFAHLLEYHLRDRSPTVWHHELIARAILYGQHAPEDRAHQIFANTTIGCRDALRRADIHIDLVEAILTRAHPLSALVAGSLDLDNLDNVARMSSALGIDGGRTAAVAIASQLTVDPHGNLLLPTSLEPHVAAWAALRRQAYEIILFDRPTMATQAVLSDCMAQLLDAGALSIDDWSLTDAALLRRLLRHPLTKTNAARYVLGTPPPTAFIVQVDASSIPSPLDDRAAARALVNHALQIGFPAHRTLSYAAQDRGTFEKEVTFIDSHSGTGWSVGTNSSSLLLYGFVLSNTPPGREACRLAVRTLLSSLPSNQPATLRFIGPEGNGDPSQRTLDFTTS